MHTANVYVYDVVGIAAGILSNHQMRAVNYDHVLCLLTIHQMHKLALQYTQWQRQTEKLVRLKLQRKTSSLRIKF